MKKIIIITLIFLSFGTVGYAQQDALFSHYMFNKLVLNPAYAGCREVFTAQFLGRAQWIGIDGAPNTGTLSIHSPLRNRNMGLGMYVYNDRIDPMVDWGFIGTYSYKIRIGGGKLSFGLQGGIKKYEIDWNKLNTFDPATGKKIVENSVDNKIIPDANFGLYYYTSRFYLGVSSKHLLENDHSITEFVSIISGETNNVEMVSTRLFRHFYIMGGLAAPLGDNVVFRPSFLIKTVKHSPMQLDINASFLLNKTLWLGASYRTERAVVFMAELLFNDFRFGYSYDIWMNELKAYNTGSHELMLGFDVNPNKSRMLTPRYF
jgi:type IX secretion system PorP/SprF family membrane protein